MPSFIHLRLHSEYSITDGLVRLESAVTKAAADEMPALALTDSGNLFGLLKFYQAARSRGLKAIAGVEVAIRFDQTSSQRVPFNSGSEPLRENPRIVLLVQNQQGYLRLCDWLTRAYSRDLQGERKTTTIKGGAELVSSWFQAHASNVADTKPNIEANATEGFTEGLIALSGGRQGDVGQALLAGNVELAIVRAKTWSSWFPNRYYLEVQRVGHPDEETLNQLTLHVARTTGLPVVATHPVQFLAREDFKAHEARTCVADGYLLADSRRPKRFTPEQYFKTQAEMTALFADIPEALVNTVEIAKRCNLTLTLGQNFLPQFPTPAGLSVAEYFQQLAEEGLRQKFPTLFPELAQNPDQPEYQKQQALYAERLAHEVKMIIQMGFPGYFLIVADFINWAKQHAVPVGPGRGSGAGSLVAYCLGITDLDPIRYGLLFERFLNPERVSMPDFDVDFCQDNRYQVIDYVRAKYGAQAVSQIVTFGTMSSKAVIRDVGRVLNLPYTLCDQLSKLIPVEQNKPLSLTKARENEPQLGERLAEEEGLEELWELALKLEDITRNVGMHAGGVLIAPNKLTDFCPLYRAEGEEAALVSQFDKDDVEAIGLVKFDFLGLRNLTIIALAQEYIRQLDPDAQLDLAKLTFDDPAAYQILKDANTTAVFQVESAGMKKLLAKLQPDRFEDIIAVLALYRPGPLGSGMVDDFILRKKGQQRIDYFHPDLQECLSPTYGVIVYQEQVMQIAQIIGGYSLGGADLLRRAMGKKKPEEMAKHRSIFIEGALKKGYSQPLAEQLFDLMAKFAEYGFNKSHTAAYAVITYQTAWLKAHYPAAFLAATLSSDLDNTDSIHFFVQDALANGLTLLPPDIQQSEYRFIPIDPKTIRYGLGAIKGTGQNAVENILAARRAGPFTDFFDFCQRIDRRIVNRRALEALVKAGAFDHLHPNRAEIFASIGLALDAAEQHALTRSQASLFGEQTFTEMKIPSVRPWSTLEKLQHEKSSLGFYLSGHPYQAYQAELQYFIRTTLGNLQPARETQWLAGIIKTLRIQMTRRGKMAVVLLEDGQDQLEITLFSELYETHREWLKEDQLLIVQGTVREDTYTGGLRVSAEKIFSLGAARNRFAKRLRLRCVTGTTPHKILELLAPFQNAETGCNVSILYQNQQAVGELQLATNWKVSLEDQLLATLQQTLGNEKWQIQYS